MTYREMLRLINPKAIFETGECRGCPSDYAFEPIDYTDNCKCNDGEGCEYCWNREIPGEEITRIKRLFNLEEQIADDDTNYSESKEYAKIGKFCRDGFLAGIGQKELTPRILDSGNRRKFETGAVRDIQEGKGRCDLLPLDVIARMTNNHVLDHIHGFQFQNDTLRLEMALQEFITNYTNWCFDGYYISQGLTTMCLEVSKHFEEGAKKYGEHNWQKGIPTHCYIDSAVRHYLKWLRGDHDEPHDRAFCWNILCCIWTCINKPELNDYAKNNEEKKNDND